MALLSDGAAVVFESAASRAADIVAKVVLGVVAVGEISCGGTAATIPAAKAMMSPESCILARMECRALADLHLAMVLCDEVQVFINLHH